MSKAACSSESQVPLTMSTICFNQSFPKNFLYLVSSSTGQLQNERVSMRREPNAQGRSLPYHHSHMLLHESLGMACHHGASLSHCSSRLLPPSFTDRWLAGPWLRVNIWALRHPQTCGLPPPRETPFLWPSQVLPWYTLETTSLGQSVQV